MTNPRVLGFCCIFLASGLAMSCSEGGHEGAAGPLGAFASLELEASYPEPFSFLNSVRELSAGTVMAADPLSQVLLRVDMVAGTADTIGAVGGGPEEYEQPDQVYPLPNDSTLLVDLGKASLTVIGPEGTFHEGMSMARPDANGRLNVLFPRVLDEQGRIYFSGRQGGRMGQEGAPDSVPIIRYDRTTERSDTVAMAWAPELQISRSGGNVRVMPRMMQGRDDWAVGTDGRVAVIHLNEYAVEWFNPDGSAVVGPPTPFESRSISEEDKVAELEGRFSGGGLSMMMTTGSGGGGQVSMSRGGFSGGEGPAVSDFEWAETFPPFRSDRARVSASGEVWVEQWLPADMDPRMDVFDSQGVRVGYVDMPLSSQLLGFGTTADGQEAAYIVRTDELGLMWLERYRVLRNG